MTPSAVRDRLAQSLAVDLRFHRQNSSYGPHSLHAFAAKFPPQIPRLFITNLTEPEETVFDPMVGSGTTMVEAVLLGRRAIGVDIDPLATLISKIKTAPLEPDTVRKHLEKVTEKARNLLSAPDKIDSYLSLGLDQATRHFVNYWFLARVQREIVALLIGIQEEVRDAHTAQFLRALVSSIIVTKSGGISLARDLAHSRPHLDKTKNPKGAIDAIIAKARKVLNGVYLGKQMLCEASTIRADAQALPLKDESVHLIMTSPPYANAIDYVRAHKFSLVWLGYPIKKLGEMRGRYMGNERVKAVVKEFPIEVGMWISRLAKKDERKANLLANYFADMYKAMSEMLRVLIPGRACIIVVGPSTMRGVEIPTHWCLGFLARSLGFECLAIAERTLDRDKRMLPTRSVHNGHGIQLRVHKEYVLGLLKPDGRKSPCQRARKPTR